jgi:hypothetical protein
LQPPPVCSWQDRPRHSSLAALCSRGRRQLLVLGTRCGLVLEMNIAGATSTATERVARHMASRSNTLKRLFPPPWSVDDPDPKLDRPCFIVRDADGHARRGFTNQEVTGPASRK